jgi:hypothetical protein
MHPQEHHAVQEIHQAEKPDLIPSRRPGHGCGLVYQRSSGWLFTFVTFDVGLGPSRRRVSSHRHNVEPAALVHGGRTTSCSGQKDG